MKKAIPIVIWLIIMGCTISFAQVANNNYCVNPVFSANAVKPNIMIVQDQSGSMQFPAYIGCNLDSYGSNKQADCCVRSTTADGYTNDKYRVAQNYYGYFENDSYYQYSSGNNRFEINTACTNTDKIGTSGCISGNLLNWITTTRTDVVRKALTGGRRYATDTSNVTLQSEGARFENTSSSYSCVTTAPAYRSGNRYNVGDTVSYSGSNYVCIVAHRTPSHLPTDAAYWQPAVYDYVAYFTDNTLNCTFMITASQTYTRQLNISGASCPLGTLSNAYIRIKKDKPVIDGVTQDYWGIVNDFYDKASFEFMIYKSDIATNYGKILNGKTDPTNLTAKDSLYNNINTTLPYYGTPTGEAMNSAREFFRQKDQGLSYSDNSAYISLGNANKDPYYDEAGTTDIAVPCRQSYILLLSDGNWNVSEDPAKIAYNLHTTDQRTTALSNNLPESQTVTTYAIYAFGDKDTETRAKGRNAMITTAIMGGFSYDSKETTPLPYGFSAVPSDSREVEYPLASCDPLGTWNAGCVEWDKEGTGYPYNYFEFKEDEDGEVLVERITDAIFDMLRRSSSGTAASVLASSEGSGANLLQALFFPKAMFDNNVDISWIGQVQNLWYYIDPAIGGSTIREDTDENKRLNLVNDDIINFYFDDHENRTRVRRYKGDDPDTEDTPSPVEVGALHNLWEAGGMLWKRDLTTAPRNIFTYLTSGTKTDFTVANASLLQASLQATTIAEAQNIINFTHGYAVSGYRSRNAQTTYKGTTGTYVWKLGDIVSSTPRSKSSIPLNAYHLPSPEGYSDTTYYKYINDLNQDGTTNTNGHYKERGMVYVGGNDGMLHAFELGKLNFSSLGTNEVATLDTTDVAIGTERWAFIPRNALPYLRYPTATDYCHVFMVDNPPQLIDASIGASATATKNAASWRTIVLGSMGIGGACRNTCASGGNCVQNPITNTGHSSYFALDVTNPTNPSLLWEFTHDELGYSTTGAAIVRIGDPDKNGYWYAVVASGPTGPIDTANHQFMGRSDQELKLFVIDLRTGSLVGSPINVNNKLGWLATTAFGGSLYNATIDIERGSANPTGKYSDDVIYMGYTKDTGLNTWKKGGVLRIQTNNSVDPGSWTISSVIDNIGPVTSAITKLQDRNRSELWLYFGTGRFYYKLADGTIDDAGDTGDYRSLYGVREPCYTTGNTLTSSCTTVSESALQDKSTDATDSYDSDGWYIHLNLPADVSTSTYAAERVITDPLAAFSGVVFFTTFEPSNSVCSLGGNTYVWATHYRTGGLPSSSALQGKAMIQVSTGQIQEMSLSDVFSSSRKSEAIKGLPPRGQGLSVVLGPRPMRRILHIKEK